MIGRVIPPLLLLLLSLFALSPPAAAEGSSPVVFGQGELTLATTGGAKFHFSIEIAETEDQLHQGLMFRDSMPADAGMLFLLGTEQIASFWMRNTFLPLDMVFIARDGRVTNIHHDAAPGSTAIISSTAPVTGVLELNGGVAARLGIHAGDRVIHPAFP